MRTMITRGMVMVALFLPMLFLASLSQAQTVELTNVFIGEPLTGEPLAEVVQGEEISVGVDVTYDNLNPAYVGIKCAWMLKGSGKKIAKGKFSQRVKEPGVVPLRANVPLILKKKLQSRFQNGAMDGELVASLVAKVQGRKGKIKQTFSYPFTILATKPPVEPPVEIGCGERLLGGYTDIDPYEGSPLAPGAWKAFRFAAYESGQANCVTLFLKGLIGDRSDDEVGVAIYEDNNGEVGSLKAWGYVPHYNWNVIGTWQFHSFLLDRVETSREILQGGYYWVTVQSSGGTNVLIERGRANMEPLPKKRGAEQPAVSLPPPGSAFNIVFDDGGYRWSVW